MSSIESELIQEINLRVVNQYSSIFIFRKLSKITLLNTCLWKIPESEKDKYHKISLTCGI